MSARNAAHRAALWLWRWCSANTAHGQNNGGCGCSEWPVLSHQSTGRG